MPLRGIPGIIALAFAQPACGDVVLVEPPDDEGEIYQPDAYAPRHCSAPWSACVLDRCDDACPGGPKLEPSSACSCCRAGTAPPDIETPFDLRVHGADLDAISGRAVFAAVGPGHDKDAQNYARAVVCDGRLDLLLENMVPPASPGIAAFVDVNDDGLCDSETDAGIDASLFGTSEDVEVEITSEVLALSSELTCQHFGYYLWVRGYDFPAEGTEVVVRLRDVQSAQVVAERRASIAFDAAWNTLSFLAEFHAPLLGGRSYSVDVLLDVDADGSCDPLTDAAWRKPLGPVKGTEAVHLYFDEARDASACAAFGAAP
jgi:hypothetical protein